MIELSTDNYFTVYYGCDWIDGNAMLNMELAQSMCDGTVD